MLVYNNKLQVRSLLSSKNTNFAFFNSNDSKKSTAN